MAAFFRIVQPQMKIIDTHQHLWDLQKFPYAWTAYHDVLNRSFLLEDYQQASSDYEIVQTVFVEADVDEPYMLGEARWAAPFANGVVAACRPEKPEFRSYLKQLSSIQNLKGVRRVLHTEPYELSGSELFRENIRSLEDFDLTFDICVSAQQLPQAIDLIKNCPNIKFILDHCGNPNIKNHDYNMWTRYIDELAAYPNVIGCKISGIVVNTDINNWNVDDLRPVINHVIKSFGWTRVMFGSDWPVCLLASAMKRWIYTLMLIVINATEPDKAKLFSENARRIYRLK